MSYPDPTVEQMLIFAVAVVAPLVWAFTHHGNTRMLTLALWLPCLLFVMRVVFPVWGRWPADAPLEQRLKIAAGYSLIDPTTIFWPVFVFLTFGLIRLFSARRQRREANATRAVVDARRQPPAPAQTVPAPPLQPKEAATGDSPRAPQSQHATCRHCGTPVVSPNARYCAGCGIALG